MPHTSTQIRQALADGRAVKRFHLDEESWYADTNRTTWGPSVVKSWSVGVDALTEDGRNDGTFGEFTIQWHEFGDGRGPSMRLCVFSETFVAMRACEDLVEWLFALTEDASPEEVLGLLASLGFVDKTERVNPQPAA